MDYLHIKMHIFKIKTKITDLSLEHVRRTETLIKIYMV